MNYKCSFCGKEYDNVDDCVACVSKCAVEKKNEDYRIRKERIEKEKSARLKELKKAEKVYNELLEKYIDDYGWYESHLVNPKDWLSPFNLLL